MAHYLDTSAFLKLVVRERGSAALRRWVQESERELFASDLLRVESLRAARRHSTDAVAAVRAALRSVTLVALAPSICEHAADLDPVILRSLDALHLATALAVGDDLEAIVTYDERMIAAAGLLGLTTTSPS